MDQADESCEDSRYLFLIHGLRRSAARELMEAGNQQLVVMAISGHKTAALFSRYNIVSTEQVHAAMKRMVKVEVK